MKLESQFENGSSWREQALTSSKFEPSDPGSDGVLQSPHDARINLNAPPNGSVQIAGWKPGVTGRMPVLLGRCGVVAFTLIELLVVISIIAVLAGLVLAAMPGTAKWRTRRAVEAQMQQWVTLIERYKEERGYYPPSNPRSSSTNLLFYELVGAQFNASPNPPTVFEVVDHPDLTITPLQIQKVYGNDPKRTRIFNASTKRSTIPDPGSAYDPDAGLKLRSLHAEVKDKQFTTTADGIVLLTVPAKGPMGDFNPWHYVVPGIHHPNGFDLWAEVLLGNKIVTLGNWKEGK